MDVYDGPPIGRVSFRNPFTWEANNQEDYLRMASEYRKQREEELASILAWEKEKSHWQAKHSMPDNLDGPKEPLPTSEGEMSPLGQKILKHWRQYRKGYFKALTAEGKLFQTAEQAALDHAETYSSLRSKPHNLAHDQAEEIAREPWIS